MGAGGPSPSPIEVRRYGRRGPQVVLLHGGPGTPGEMASLARELEGEFRVLEPLQRRAAAVPLTVARHVEDLAAVAPRGAAIVGFSWGAMLALSHAVAHPEQGGAVVLVGCGTYDEAGRAHYRRAMEEGLGPEGRRRRDELKALLARARDDAERDAILTELGDLYGPVQAYEPLPEDPRSEREGLPLDARGHDETWQDVLRLQAGGIEPAAFAAIHVPVTMLHGDEDPHPGPRIRDLLRRYVPHLAYERFARCGHKPWIERHARDDFLAALRAVLRGAST